MVSKASAKLWRVLAARGKLIANAAPVRLTCDRCRRPVGLREYRSMDDAARAARVHLIDYPAHNGYVRYARSGVFRLETEADSNPRSMMP